VTTIKRSVAGVLISIITKLLAMIQEVAMKENAVITIISITIIVLNMMMIIVLDIKNAIMMATMAEVTVVVMAVITVVVKDVAAVGAGCFNLINN
ncbi:hypothetical protein V7158_16780, partial [Priestia megaterium]|uniref:hypothetical protein n=2 Tax=Priestia megaterium TaxID=1404 RepID=UPI003000F75A